LARLDTLGEEEQRASLLKLIGFARARLNEHSRQEQQLQAQLDDLRTQRAQTEDLLRRAAQRLGRLNRRAEPQPGAARTSATPELEQRLAEQDRKLDLLLRSV